MTFFLDPSIIKIEIEIEIEQPQKEGKGEILISFDAITHITVKRPKFGYGP
jgi:hypothetical protein